MKKMLSFQRKKQTLKRKLFRYMFLLVALLLILFFVGMLLIDGYSGAKRQLADTLSFQSEVFARQIQSHYSNLAVMGIQLSERASSSIDCYLDEHGLSFDELTGSQLHIEGIQDALIEKLLAKLFETECSGAFIMLDTQVNPHVENA